MMVSNSSGERSFSKIELIKNHLQTNMEQEPLVDLSKLSLESDIIRGLSFDNILHKFIQKEGTKSSF